MVRIHGSHLMSLVSQRPQNSGQIVFRGGQPFRVERERPRAGKKALFFWISGCKLIRINAEVCQGVSVYKSDECSRGFWAPPVIGCQEARPN